MSQDVNERDRAFAAGVYEETFALAHAPAAVWRALLEPAALRTWFAEHAEVEPRIGGRYAFGGRFTPFGAPDDPPQRLTALEPERRLAFAWTWCGASTQVELRLAATKAGTALTVRHELVGAAVGKSQRESCWLANDFWGVSIGNLDGFLRTGRPVLRPDHREPRDVAEVAIEIDAPVERVWRSLVDPEELREWMGASAPRVEPRVGGAYSYGWVIEGGACGPERILVFEPERRLVVDWRHEGSRSGRCEWLLEPLGPTKTRVTVRQHGTGGGREFHGYLHGWAKYLFALKARGEARQA